MPILVLYTTSQGSTAGIANRIAARIELRLPPCEVRNIADFNADYLPNYTAVVLGSPIHGAQWLDKAVKFYCDNKDVLILKPVYAFSVGAPNALPEWLRGKWGAFEEGKIEMSLQKALHGKVTRHTLLSGKLLPKKEPLVVRLCCGILGGEGVG
ncbi:hypothetical protein EK21DRAFT_89140 [Setomelanomma holmii]|uniref:Flavodoxin-like domain-containing protein n=1 Tax=Setomelanomma holmii TaxID=210430 RepID=A0A9P4HAX2_9PLEO|nr:hypothetical protein EK21DRAFT_89140 [Setomelanomma holmii]